MGTSEEFLAFERRWNRAWHAVPYPLIAVAAVITLATPSAPHLIVAVLVGAVIVWHVWFFSLHPDWPERRLAPMALYFAGLVSGALVLTSLSEPFIVLLIGCFPMAFVAVPGHWAYVAVGLTGAACLFTLGGSRPSLGLAAQMLGATVFAGAIGWAIRRIEHETTRRREAHAELVRISAEKDRLQALLIAAARDAGVASERARLARDIHDTLAQGLAGISTNLETAEELLPDEHVAAKQVRTALDLARSSLTEARRSVHALRPGPLQSGQLISALQAIVDQWQHHTGITATIRVTGTTLPSSSAVDTALLRIVQESLANIAKHANASQVTVTVSYLDDLMAVDIFDDGRGFSPTAAHHAPGPAGGYGVAMMNERLAEIGGQLSIESAPGQGTTVTATVPPYRTDG